MNVIIFGATGTVGRLATQRMLDAGHRVTAFARNPDKLDIEAPALTRIAGDATDAAAVTAALQGQDAVVVTLGAGMTRRSTIRSQGTLAIIRGMQHHGIRRLIVQSTLGAHESWSNLNFFWKRIMFGALLRPVFQDHQRQEDMVRASGLDWTLVRPGAFTDGPATGDYLEGFGPETRGLKLKISRADLAVFLTRQLADRSNAGRAVAVSA
ncbi:NAD(P)-dependent oxidoreductase [Jannaschia sp. M317]|uniref:NAD(P)-dependent oxidoreductase n=1 Tax=Jannaschia sp. M317 TaxID=2867011 RepID=UPI0021A44408|nr:SDR family oxidoreductase [Jannaschia sp. M317]UWQ19167.1 SDR family oxidoreductase [Jannaschia sp. M317]